mmetsp:Transcript_23295/g.46758  ORF Transcript_23295/g.46758 Transcript_23295/m.46758 type:complete len:268 (+) Transcript_23295:1067-1870(+)
MVDGALRARRRRRQPRNSLHKLLRWLRALAGQDLGGEEAVQRARLELGEKLHWLRHIQELPPSARLELLHLSLEARRRIHVQVFANREDEVPARLDGADALVKRLRSAVTVREDPDAHRRIVRVSVHSVERGTQFCHPQLVVRSCFGLRYIQHLLGRIESVHYDILHSKFLHFLSDDACAATNVKHFAGCDVFPQLQRRLQLIVASGLVTQVAVIVLRPHLVCAVELVNVAVGSIDVAPYLVQLGVVSLPFDGLGVSHSFAAAAEGS